MASRSIEDLTPKCKDKYLEWQQELEKANIYAKCTCTLRSYNEQVALYAQGREDLDIVNHLRFNVNLPPITAEQNKKCVTWTMKSRHFAGKDGKAIAWDFIITDKQGKGTYDLKADIDEDKIPDYTEAGLLAEKCGLVWGGRFKDRNGKPTPDYCHVELSK